MVWDTGLGGIPRSVIATLDSNVFSVSTTEVMPDLVDGANYLFAVRAENSIGWGSYSASTTLMAASKPGKPNAPTVIQASSASITIQWVQPTTGGSPITNYYVYMAEGPTIVDANFEQVADTGESMQFIMTKLSPSQTYWFKVVARNLVGLG